MFQQEKEEDRRLTLINRTMRMHGSEPHALIETLYGPRILRDLDMEHLKYAAKALRGPSE